MTITVTCSRERWDQLIVAEQELLAFRRSFDGHVYVKDADYMEMWAKLRAAETVAADKEIAVLKERERCAKIAEARALKLRAKAKDQITPGRQSYFAQAIEARVIAEQIRKRK